MNTKETIIIVIRNELIDVCMDQLMLELKNEDYLNGLSREDFIGRLAYYLGEMNTIHPFREGNGRAGRAFIRELARRNGHKLTLENIDTAEMIKASDKAFHHEYEALENLLAKVLTA